MSDWGQLLKYISCLFNSVTCSTNNYINNRAFIVLTFISVLSFDWMHIYLINGIYAVEVDHLFDALAKERHGFKEFSRYCSAWRWPKAYAKARDIGDSIGRLTASEQLSMNPVLRRYLVEVVVPDTREPAKVRSALLLCDVIEIIQASMGNLSCPDDLEASIRKHLEARLEAYSAELWRPKSEMPLRLALSLSMAPVGPPFLVFRSRAEAQRTQACRRRPANNVQLRTRIDARH